MPDDDKKSGLDAVHAPRPTRRRARWPFAIGAIAVLAAAGVLYWGLAGTSQVEAQVATADVVRGDIEDSVSALGNLQPRDYVDVGAQTSGQLKDIRVQVGDQVEQNDLLAEIDPVVLNARVEASRAQLAGQRAQLVDREAQLQLAQQQLQRQRALRKSNATSEESLQSAEASAKSAAAQIEVLKADIQQTESTLRGDEATLGYTKVYAPMAGTVVTLDARKGQTLNTNQSTPILMRIADLSVMTVWTQVSEADVARLKLGMRAYFTTLGSDGRSWEGKLRQILPTPEVVNNVVLYTALFDVDNPKGELLTQMTAQVFFVVAEARDVVQVPTAAIKRRGRGPNRQSLVTVMDEGGGTEERSVETGVTTRVVTEIRAGLAEGERVVLPASAGQTADAGRPQRSQRRGPPPGMGL